MFFKKLRGDEKAATAVEYSILAASVATGILISVLSLGNNVGANFCKVSNALGSASTSCSVVMNNANNVPAAIDPVFVPASQGGQDTTFMGNMGLFGGLGGVLSQVLSDINSKDPIRGIYGMKYDTNNELSSIGTGYNPTVREGNNIESYSALLQGLQNGTYTWGDNTSDEDGKYQLVTRGTNAWNNDPNVSEATFENNFYNNTVPSGVAGMNGKGTMFQIVTNSGQVYNINGGAYLLANEQNGGTGTNFMSVTNANTGQIVEKASGSFSNGVDSNNNYTATTNNVKTSGFNP